jgi:broad specificity phosphatase PhoE
MKPDRIFIVRHGQSQGNVDKEIYKNVPDYALQLTDLGHKQSEEAGKKTNHIITDISYRLPLAGNHYYTPSVQYYVSPFWRTRQTYLGIKKYLTPSVEKYYEDPRLREQEWSSKLREDGFMHEAEDERDSYGHFYYRFDGGESCADVFDRVSDFMNTMHRDFQKQDFPRNVIIVSHGMTMRLFLMRWFHVPVEEFEVWANPKNAELLILERQADEKYNLVTPMRIHKIKHSFQFPWGDNKPNLEFPTRQQIPYDTKPR